MPGILREVTEHALKIRPGSTPVKQRLCRFDDEKRRAIGEEIAKLLVVKTVFQLIVIYKCSKIKIFMVYW